MPVGPTFSFQVAIGPERVILTGDYLSPFKILVLGIASLRSSRGSAPSDHLHRDSIPALHSPQADVRKQGTWTTQSVVRQVPPSGVPDLVGPSLSSGCSLPRAHLEASASTGPRALQAQPFTHPRLTTHHSKVHIRKQRQQGWKLGHPSRS